MPFYVWVLTLYHKFGKRKRIYLMFVLPEKSRNFLLKRVFNKFI